MEMKRRKERRKMRKRIEKDGWLGKTVRMDTFTNYNLL